MTSVQKRPPALSSPLVEALAPAHAEVLLLRAAGLADGEIAGWLGVPVESVAVLGEIATRKLRRLITDPRPDGHG